MALENLLGELATDAKLELVRLLLNSLDSKVILNEDSRIRVSTMPGRYALVSKDITAPGQTFAFNTDNVSNIVLQAVVFPSAAGHAATFEASLNSTNGVDGNWITIQAVRTNANIVELATGTLAATPAYGWELSVNAYKWVRVRCTAHTSGTMRWFSQAGSYATEPIPANQVTSVTANLGTMLSALYIDSSTNLGASAVYTGASRDAGSSNTYSRFVARSFTDQIGTLAIQDSTDGTTWRTVKSIDTVANTMADLDVEVVSRYHRVVFTNGAANATTILRVTSALKKI